MLSKRKRRKLESDKTEVKPKLLVKERKISSESTVTSRRFNVYMFVASAALVLLSTLGVVGTVKLEGKTGFRFTKENETNRS